MSFRQKDQKMKEIDRETSGYVGKTMRKLFIVFHTKDQLPPSTKVPIFFYFLIQSSTLIQCYFLQSFSTFPHPIYTLPQQKSKVLFVLIILLFKHIRMPQDINLILPSQAGAGEVYISDLKTAQSLSTLKEYKIGAIVTVTRRGKLYHAAHEVPRYLYLPAEDHENFDISQDFIEESRRHTNVLVHCTAGVSRSATIVAAYLIAKYNYPSQEALEYMRQRRPKIEPNLGFRRQLEKISVVRTWKKEFQEDQETISSPVKLDCDVRKSESLFKPKFIEKDYKENPEGYRHARVQSGLQSALPARRKQYESYSRQKTASKIERVKASIINKLTNASPMTLKGQKATSKAQDSIFSNLLHSKIYQNKLRVKS